MANLRNKGLNVTVGLIFDGVQQTGSFAKVESFKLTPDADLPTSDFLGEAESDPDFIHNGYQFDFTIHEADRAAVVLYNRLVDASAAGTVMPRADLVVVTTYVNPAVPALTEVLEEIVLKLDSRDVGGRKDYVKNSFSGRCKTKRTV